MSKDCIWELPGSPVVRTLRFQCHGPWFNPWLETKILHAAQTSYKNNNKNKKQNKGEKPKSSQ